MQKKPRSSIASGHARVAALPVRHAVRRIESDDSGENGARVVRVTFDAETLLEMLLDSRTDRPIISWSLD